MTAENITLRGNYLQTLARFYAVRARRAIDSQKNFWEARAIGCHAASLTPPRRAKLILRLSMTQPANPLLQRRVENLFCLKK